MRNAQNLKQWSNEKCTEPEGKWSNEKCTEPEGKVVK